MKDLGIWDFSDQADGELNMVNDLRLILDAHERFSPSDEKQAKEITRETRISWSELKKDLEVFLYKEGGQVTE